MTCVLSGRIFRKLHGLNSRLGELRRYVKTFWRKPLLARQVAILNFKEPKQTSEPASALANFLESHGVPIVMIERDSRYGENAHAWDTGRHVLHVFSSTQSKSWNDSLADALIETASAIFISFNTDENEEVDWAIDRLGAKKISASGVSRDSLHTDVFLEQVFSLLTSEMVSTPQFKRKKEELSATWVNRVAIEQRDSAHQKFTQHLNLLVCPVCRETLEESSSVRALVCMTCKSLFPYNDFDIDLFNHEDVIGVRKNIWRSWFESQVQSLTHYVLEPDTNVSHSGRSDVQKFAKFMGPLDGKKVLDVGCGVADDPGYTKESATLRVGLDPYVSTSHKAFDLKVRALSEFMPFKDEQFDYVIYATSLDHVVDPVLALAEAKRVLRNDGRIFIWDTMVKRQSFYAHPKYLRKFVLDAVRPSIWRRGGVLARWFPKYRYLYLSSLRHLKARRPPVPGRVDGAHLYRLYDGALRTLFDELGLSVESEEVLLEDNIFCQKFVSLKKANS